jgi:hypothetical protein
MLFLALGLHLLYMVHPQLCMCLLYSCILPGLGMLSTTLVTGCYSYHVVHAIQYKKSSGDGRGRNCGMSWGTGVNFFEEAAQSRPAPYLPLVNE